MKLFTILLSVWRARAARPGKARRPRQSRKSPATRRGKVSLRDHPCLVGVVIGHHRRDREGAGGDAPVAEPWLYSSLGEAAQSRRWARQWRTLGLRRNPTSRVKQKENPMLQTILRPYWLQAVLIVLGILDGVTFWTAGIPNLVMVWHLTFDQAFAYDGMSILIHTLTVVLAISLPATFGSQVAKRAREGSLPNSGSYTSRPMCSGSSSSTWMPTRSDLPETVPTRRSRAPDV